ncbi:hypothetical protein FQA47_023346 [Oryzias melastigma]|uniref:Uncharacterized protein n=1 Tax=Oryzias melastigma TaxID=30732 RepID=A0A834CJF9_ORYME|nr:hypothetical protein FQA47_023346 [Oryzias melastigma]
MKRNQDHTGFRIRFDQRPQPPRIRFLDLHVPVKILVFSSRYGPTYEPPLSLPVDDISHSVQVRPRAAACPLPPRVRASRLQRMGLAAPPVLLSPHTRSSSEDETALAPRACGGAAEH